MDPRELEGAHGPDGGDATRLRRTPDFPIPNIPVTNVAGFGAETDTRADIAVGSVTFIPSAEGDATVPHASATWLRGASVRTFSLPVGVYPAGGVPFYHSQIWDAPPIEDDQRPRNDHNPESLPATRNFEHLRPLHRNRDMGRRREEGGGADVSEEVRCHYVAFSGGTPAFTGFRDL